ncbi:MAG: AMP-binding protein [Tannerella sp.]|jgi:phenylacetate-CoA ligase|nr:AMP-binding protein [Tannerella sp.]
MDNSIKLQRLPQPEIKAFQEKKMSELLEYVNARSVYYSELFARENINIAKVKHIEDLQQIPVTTKQDLQLRYSDFICVPKSDIRDYVTTSGTLGTPVTFADTAKDLQRLALSEALSYEFAGCTPSDIIQLMVTIDRCFMAGQACQLGSLKFGSGLIRTGNGIPELQWNVIRRINPAVCVCVPSFLLKLIDFAAANGIDYRNSSLKRVICVGETVRTNHHTYNILGEKIHALWPELSMHVNYASTEMQSSFNECEKECGTHHKPDLTIVEFLDDNDQPVKADEPGEITVTTIGVEGMPLVRFKTGDVCYHFEEPCACGRNSLRLGPILGRKGQMIKYKGTTLYPAALYDILENIPEVKNYIVEVYTNTIGTDGIRILIGSPDNSETFIKRIKDLFRSKIRVAPDVVFEPVELIARKQMPPTSRKLIKFFDYREDKA